MLRPFRFYSIASFAAILAAALLLAALYHRAAIDEIEQVVKHHNLLLAHGMASTLRPELADYLGRTGDADAAELASARLPEHLATAFEALLEDASVARIKIYNRHGTVVYSTTPSQIGESSSVEHHDGFQTAIAGHAISYQYLHDGFTAPDDDSAERDNTVETYVPIRLSSAGPVAGVLEIYTDAGALVKANERATYQLIVGSGVILFTLYLALLLVVRHARGIIEAQQKTIAERNATLEMLSARLMNNEEGDKKRIATDLHEGVAQLLSAIKMHIECLAGTAADRQTLDTIVPAVQDAIREVRELALELHPPSLDEIGLLPTLDTLCRRFEELHPRVRLEKQISLSEQRPSPAMKAVIYRVVAAALRGLAADAEDGRVRLELRQQGRAMVLEIELAGRAGGKATATADGARFLEVQERTVLSGGNFALQRLAGGGVHLRVAWDESRLPETV
jgi:signal transduction histidine kinase